MCETQESNGLKGLMLGMEDETGELEKAARRTTFEDDDAIAVTKEKFSLLCEEFVLSFMRTRVLPHVESKLADIDIPPTEVRSH